MSLWLLLTLVIVGAAIVGFLLAILYKKMRVSKGDDGSEKKLDEGRGLSIEPVKSPAPPRGGGAEDSSPEAVEANLQLERSAA